MENVETADPIDIPTLEDYGRLSDLRLVRPLGDWTNNGHMQWKWLVSPSERMAYRRDETEEFNVFPLIRNKLQSRTPTMHLDDANELPSDVVPIQTTEAYHSVTMKHLDMDFADTNE